MGKNSSFLWDFNTLYNFECMDTSFFKFIKPLYMAKRDYSIIFPFAFILLEKKICIKSELKRKITFTSTSTILYIFIIGWASITYFRIWSFAYHTF